MSLINLFLILIAVTYPLAKGAVNISGSRDGRLGATHESGAKAIAFLIFLILAISFGFRGIVAEVNDEYVYRNRVLRMVGKELSVVLPDSSEYIDTIACWIVSRLFPGESQWLLVYYSTVTFALLIIFIYKYCDNFELGILLIFLLNIANVSMNTMQQMEAVAISTLGIPYVYKRNFVKYAIVIAAATLVHNSAIILIAVYFIANMKPWSPKFLGVAFSFVIIMVIFNTVAPNLFSRMEIFEEYDDTFGNGVKIITVIVAFIPVIFAFFMRSHFPKDDTELNYAINMSLVYAMIYLVATQNKYVARFGMFIQPYLIVLYTKALTHLKKENLSTVFKFMLITGYGATMIYFVQGIRYTFVWLF
ncbi:MAG: EpsG family protein [Clostridia bacterium]|nr:EpsG family protein [Clostridia bacterium]